MKFYQQWIQQGKVPVNAQTNCPVKVELDDGDVRDQLPASAVGLQAESTSIDLTGSNQEGRKEYPSVSPTTPVSKPTVSVVRASTVMPLSNCNGRPDNDHAARYTCDEAIDNDVQVVRDLRVSHNGVPVTVGGYSDVRISNTEVRVQGVSPPSDQRVQCGRVKGRTSSTPSAKFVYNHAQRIDTTSSRSTSSLHEKLQSDTTLGKTTVALKSNLKFDNRAQSVRHSTATPEGTTFPSSRGCSLPSQFDILMPSASFEFDELKSSNNPAPVLQSGMRMSSRTPSRVMGHYKVSYNAESTNLYASSTKSSMDNQLRPVRLTDKEFA